MDSELAVATFAPPGESAAELSLPPTSIGGPAGTNLSHTFVFDAMYMDPPQVVVLGTGTIELKWATSNSLGAVTVGSRPTYPTAHMATVTPNASDNTSGVAVMLEAMRILKAVGAEPRRTIRIALWSGEEQGLWGSRAYVRDHFGDPNDPGL